MVLDLKQVFANEGFSLPIEYEMDMSSADYSGEFPLKKPVLVKGSISNRASMVQLSLKISYVFSGDCHRCGIPTERDYLLNLEKSVAVSVENEENDTIITVPDMKLDLDELVFGEVYMSLPMKHLCNENCKGICSKCGKNLNDGECGCPKKEIDPRLAKLAELLEN
ncbi:MAG: DUF177 domain-containing protein [Oscillospiraceae bacterium]|nr:DUF177 domain-containing protein [Oscillospiraceae bacterium]